MPRSGEHLDDLLLGLEADDFDDEGEITNPPLLEEKGYLMPAPGLDFGIMPIGFSTGRGSAVKPPSAEALKRARSLFEKFDAEGLSTSPSDVKRIRADDTPSANPPCDDGSTYEPRVTIPEPSMIHNKQSVQPPSASSFNTPGPSTPGPSSFPAVTPGGTASGFSLGSGKIAPRPTPSSVSRALAIFSDLETPAAGPSNSGQMANPPPSFRTPSRSTPVVRRPLQISTNMMSSGATPLGKIPIDIKTPTRPRRIGMGGSQRATKQRGFTTPFQRNRPDPTCRATPNIRGLAQNTPFRPVFDLKRPGPRQTLLEAHFHPQYYTPDDLQEAGISREILFMTVDRAPAYEFQGPTPAGRPEAFRTLLQDGCSLVTTKWIDNHWALILWKIAGMIQAKPSLTELWSFAEVIRQLKYRYEREFGAAQRPVLRRIQERDTPPSVPMVLCIVKLYSIDANAVEASETEGPKSMIELTDGWYRILAEADDCLGRAIRRGRIKPGQKLAISGARLDSNGDGVDALDDRNHSRLLLSANSCSLARWHERLGARSQTFVAGLSSLTADGGAIVLMDIVVDRLYPIAFMSPDKGERDVWNEEEEASRANAWQERYSTEYARVSQEVQARLERLEEIVSMLSSAADGRLGSPSLDSSDALAGLLAARDPHSRIRSMSRGLASQLAVEGREKLQSEMSAAQTEVDTELQTLCPPRVVRNFRMLRLRDARAGQEDSYRVGMLKVWEAASLGSTLREGGRYLVTNLVPSFNGNWSLSKGTFGNEVYLNTRSNTRWVPVEMR